MDDSLIYSWVLLYQVFGFDAFVIDGYVGRRIALRDDQSSNGRVILVGRSRSGWRIWSGLTLMSGDWLEYYKDHEVQDVILSVLERQCATS